MDDVGATVTEPQRALSWSQMSSWLHCGEQYRLSYIEKVPKLSQGAFIGGRAVHAAIAEAEQRGWVEDEHSADTGLGEARPDGPLATFFRETFDRELAEEVERTGGEPRWGGRRTRQSPHGEDAAWWRGVGPMMLRRYLVERAADRADGLVMRGAEMKVGAYLPSGRFVQGYVDAFLFTDLAGWPVIRDYKTGRPGGASKFQAITYAWAVRQTLKVPVRYGQFVYLRSTDRARRVETFEVEPYLGMVERKFADFERAVEANIYPLRESSMCVACSVRTYCEYGKTLTSEEEQ